MLIDATEDGLLDLVKHDVDVGLDRSPSVEIWTAAPDLEPLVRLATYRHTWADDVRRDQADLRRASEAED